ncbi:multidrug resistance-associated protein 1-like isoform X2 [Homalodisca vitripennis]|uniref:multidrug resistance-associated protein 1-like isoform X2 n=1 Tax=Homalodisca vitripennis TaxID=197043 RepID=UPI001EEAFACA|nr:multidrug resistance-associated protein 1-like isoform X2 [Homalodisca vitripennis]
MDFTNESRFCKSHFWDPAQSWNTPDPDISPCFEQTALVWGPCLLLWILAPFEAVVILNSKCRDLPWGFTNTTKMLLNLMLIGISAVNFVMSVVQYLESEEVFPVALWTPAVQTITFVLAAVILAWDRVRGVHTSGGLFVFWLMLSVAGVFQFRTELRQAGNKEEPRYKFILYMVSYPIVLLMMILNVFADPPQRVTDRPKTEKPSPAENASFVSLCFFSWFEPLIWRGFKKPLTLEDLWNLRYHDTSAYVVTRFEKRWNKLLKRSIRFSARDKKTELNGLLKDQDYTPKKPVSIIGTLFKTYWITFVNAGLLKFISDAFGLLNPLLLHLMIKFVASKDYMWKGILYVIGMLIVSQLQTICLHHASDIMYGLGVNWRTAIMSAIYKKTLRISSSARKSRSFGEIVNLMAVDAQRFVDTSLALHATWTLLLTIIGCMYFLWNILGVATLAGLAVLVIVITVNVAVSSRVRSLHLRQMKHKDERVKSVSEVLSGIKVLKMYAWEQSFKKSILKIREKELSLLKTAALLNACASFLSNCTSLLISLASFCVFVLIDEHNVMTSETAFVAIAFFNVMRGPLQYFPTVVDCYIQFFVSAKRINKFMNADELDSTSVSHDMSRNEPLTIEGGTFSWGCDKDDKQILHNITLKIQPGQLVAVVGPVGAGKSSLLSAFLGEMVKNTGFVNTKGKIAYVPQQPWIQNASVRENISFGNRYEEKEYNKTVENCALLPDLKILPGGDATEIGEKGINLSGGQKQRVSLARAVYSDADIYLMDDPLSAVDSHVGRHIFDNIIGPKGQLHKKTRILVTHGIAFLPQVDMIVVMKGGEIVERGTFKELLDVKGEFSDFLMQHLVETDQHELIPEIEEFVDEEVIRTVQRQMSKSDSIRSISSTKSDSSHKLSITQQIKEGTEVCVESTQNQTTNRDAVLYQLEEVEEMKSNQSKEMEIVENGDTTMIAETDLKDKDSEMEALLKKCQDSERKTERTYTISAIDRKSATQPEVKQKTKLIQTETAETGRVKRRVYLHYCKCMGVWLVVGTFSLSLLSQAAAILANIWLSRWTSDLSVAVNGTQDLDKRNFYLQVYFTFGLAQVVAVVASTLVLAIATVMGARHLHESILSNILRCPMSFFDTTPMGRIVNRLSKDIDVVDNMLPKNLRMAQDALVTVFGTLVIIIWSTPLFVIAFVPIGILYYYLQKIYVTTSRQIKRIESVARSPIYSHFSETLSGVSSIRAYKVEKRFINTLLEKVDTNQVCLIPSLVANRWLGIRLETITNILIFFSAFFAVLGRDSLDPGIVGLSISYALQVTSIMNNVVRMASEIENSIVSVERVKEYAELPQEAALVVEPRPKPEWPDQGVVKFQNYKVRYREGLDLILKGVSFTVSGSEKIGIVGRTGAGKSSLTVCLFRIIEAAGGHIYIDGLDIGKIGLGDLRSKLTIVPQDPVLFSGHLRMNLDPFDMHSDADIWCALELAHLSEYVKNLPQGLRHPIAEGGENLSIGQRQLICLTRALLRKTKVLILDEATAAIDLETDDLIQQTIRREFKDCTVLTIAHRLNTIMDSDRVVVLDQGLIKEFDSPENLLKCPSSIFYGLVKDAGLL